MHILNLNTREIKKSIDDIYFSKNHHFIICHPWELKFFKDTLKLSNEDYKDCLSFDDKIRVIIQNESIFFTLCNFKIDESDLILDEINIFLSEKYLLIIIRKRNDAYKQIKKLLRENFFYKSNLTLSLFIIYSNILRIIISNQFENLEKVEEMILKLEDSIIDEEEMNFSEKISDIRSICRGCVKCIRPLTYIVDTLLKGGVELFSNENINDSILEREYEKLLNGLDLSIDKLYNFALSTRELGDKLLDIYTSKVSEKTNNLINKLTFFTGTAVPISIITGIYGMNFKYMPELNYVYSYPITILVIISIMVVAFIMFKKNKFL